MTDDGRLLALLALLGVGGVAWSGERRAVSGEPGPPGRAFAHRSPLAAHRSSGSRGVVRKARAPTAVVWTPKPGDAVGAERWPLVSAHPDVWEWPHSGIVLARNDPRAWEGTFAVHPTQAEVDAHLIAIDARGGTKGETVPVAWSFASGRVYWEPIARLRPFGEDVTAWEAARQTARQRYRGSKGVVRAGHAPDRFPIGVYSHPDGEAVWAGSFEEFLLDNELDDAERAKVRDYQELFLGGGAASLVVVRRHRPNTVKRLRKSLGLESS